MSAPFNLIVILGPTASGKTRLAAAVAHALHTHIISADSRQVYTGMNIGTGKDYAEYVIDGQEIPRHLIDIVPAGDRYNIDRYLHDFYDVFDKLTASGIIPILCGGTGLYIDAVLHGFEYTSIPVNEALRASLAGKDRSELLHIFDALPETSFTALADRSSSKRLVRAIEICTYLQTNKQAPGARPKLQPLVIGLDPGREQRRARIAERLHTRLQNGMIEEVQLLLASGVDAETLEYYGLEYKFITHYLQGRLSYGQLQQQLTIAIQQFAKRQMTFFRKMERSGLNIRWIDASLPAEQQLAQALHHIRS